MYLYKCDQIWETNHVRAKDLLLLLSSTHKILTAKKLMNLTKTCAFVKISSVNCLRDPIILFCFAH